MTRAALLRKLRSLEACDEAVTWLESTDHATLQAAWDACERAEWMLWLLDKLGADRKLMVRLSCDFAETALGHYLALYPDDDRPANAIRTARRWADGQATKAEVLAASDAAGAPRDAAGAASDAAWAASDAAGAARDAAWAASAAAGAARDAAWAVRDAAGTASAAAWAASDAAGAASAAAWAASDAAGAAAHKHMAALIRKRVPNPEVV